MGKKKNRKSQSFLMGKENKKTQLPSLLTTQNVHNAEQSIFWPLESRTKTMFAPVLVNKCILASNYGWLVLVDKHKGDCCLWNPGSNDIIELPFLDKCYLYIKCVLSKPPTESDCHILFNSSSNMQSFCKIGDVEYVHSSPKEYRLVAVASFQGKIYGVMNPGYKFVTIEFVERTIEFRPMLNNKEQPWTAPIINRDWAMRHDNELIGSRDELLLVIKGYMHNNYYIVDGSEYRVFRVDINRMECTELDGIGDHAILFNYYGNGYYCSSSGTSSIKPNSIYYTSNFGAHLYVYDLDDNSTITWLPPHVENFKYANSFWVNLD
ncbi:hypothetical protein CASFOL_016113 [Castilleja foliolosa]|uniref:KIB1-4 beta-propeller domain-containing protein n=1 Tax=Castilleja foliolosa TaxID=1961234 RepID=A0ABD3DFM9_9LAMI